MPKQWRLHYLTYTATRLQWQLQLSKISQQTVMYMKTDITYGTPSYTNLFFCNVIELQFDEDIIVGLGWRIIILSLGQPNFFFQVLDCWKYCSSTYQQDIWTTWHIFWHSLCGLVKILWVALTCYISVIVDCLCWMQCGIIRFDWW
jgi:hypothetical protein